MKSLFEKLTQLAETLEKQRGPFAFFGLVHRVEALDLWDVIASAPWLVNEGGFTEGIMDLSRRVSEVLSRDEMLRLSRVAVLAPDHKAIAALLENGEIVPGRLARAEGGFEGTDFDRAYIIIPRQLAHAA